MFNKDAIFNKHKKWLNAEFIVGGTTLSYFAWLVFAMKDNPSHEEMALDPSLTCEEPHWMWVENADVNGLLLLVLTVWLFSGFLGQLSGRHNINEVDEKRLTNMRLISSLWLAVSLIGVIAIAAVMLDKGFGPDKGGDTLCDAWNQPEGDERLKFGLGWGGVITGALCTFALNVKSISYEVGRKLVWTRG